jgi:uncharacterized protein (DUF1800 family)
MTAVMENPLAPQEFPAQGWTRRDAAHLLRRTQFGATDAEIYRAHLDGVEATIDRLLSTRDESTEFTSRDESFSRLANNSGNLDDLRAWWANRMLESAHPLVERMTLFWHGHFATSNAKVQSLPQMAAQNALFRTHALGNFGDLLHAVRCRQLHRKGHPRGRPRIQRLACSPGQILAQPDSTRHDRQNFLRPNG